MRHICNITKSTIYSLITFVILCANYSCNSKQTKIETFSYLQERDSIKDIIQNKRDSIRQIEGDRVIGNIYWNMSYKDFLVSFKYFSKNHKDIASFKVRHSCHPADIIHIEETPLKEIPISINTATFYRDSLILLSLWHNEPIKNFKKEPYLLEKILSDVINLYSDKYGSPDFCRKDIKWSLLDRYIDLRGTKVHHIAEWDIPYKCIDLFVITENGFNACPVLHFYYKSKIDSINKVINKRIISIETKKRYKEMIQDSINKDRAKSII